jgi:biopolymer transport protein ExbD
VKQDPRTITINLRMDGSMNIGGRAISADQLTALLEDVKRTTPDPLSIPIVIRGDRQVQYYYGMKVLDAIKKTGLYKVSLAGMQE